MASAIMQAHIPAPEIMKTARRPRRSMVKKAMKEDRNFQVSAPPVRARAFSEDMPRLDWKMMVAYTEMRLVPLRVSKSARCHITCLEMEKYLRHLLVELQQHAKTEPVKKLVLSHREHVGQLHLVSGLLLERVLNSLKLSLDLNGIQRLGPEGSNDTAGLLGLVLHHEPSRRLGQEVDASNDDSGEDDSNGDRWAPGDGAGLELKEAEVDPRLKRVTHADEETVNDDVTATVAGSRGLTLPDGDDGAELADTEANQDTTDDELSEGEGRRLKDNTDEGGDTSDEDDISAAELIARPGAGQGADHGTDDKSCDDEALQGRVGALLTALDVDGVDLREGLGPVLHGDQPTQASLVVSEADEGRHHDEEGLHHRELVAHGAHEGDGPPGGGAAI